MDQLLQYMLYPLHFLLLSWWCYLYACVVNDVAAKVNISKLKKTITEISRIYNNCSYRCVHVDVITVAMHVWLHVFV